MTSATSFPDSSYRGRLAPSPTGYLHLGHARTFWVAAQRAREAGGKLVMRMEDLDPDRSRTIYAEAAYQDLRWLGIDWQEGPDKGGLHGPYLQSQRMPFYVDAWRKLFAGGWIYPCRCSRKDLEAAARAPHESAAGPALDDEPIYPGTCRPSAGNEEINSLTGSTKNVFESSGVVAGHDFSHAANAAKSTWALAPEGGFLAPELLFQQSPNGINWRFRVPDGEAIEFVDQNLGPQRFIAGCDFSDFVIWRRDGVPGYQLACVVDDAAMRITEVVRGADLLKSTARQILLNRALGFDNPLWFHCNLVTDANGQRLAKRHDALSLRTLHQQGISAESILSADTPAQR
jgi:glutamyl-tRNA synthetase